MIKFFNTGNQYTPEGQIILWEVTKEKEDGLVLEINFYDLSRDIAGAITVFECGNIEDAIYNEYSQGRYEQLAHSKICDMINDYSAMQDYEENGPHGKCE